jgi:hypothetical protein
LISLLTTLFFVQLVGVYGEALKATEERVAELKSNKRK